jgi:hypothetical protein
MLFVSTNWSGFFRVSRDGSYILIARVICSGFPIGNGWRRIWATYGGSASDRDLFFSAGLVFVSTRSMDLSYSKLFSRLVVPGKEAISFVWMNFGRGVQAWNRRDCETQRQGWRSGRQKGGDDGSADLVRDGWFVYFLASPLTCEKVCMCVAACPLPHL